MNTTIHKSNSRGSADHGWLKAKHSFSFASYYNPEKMGFGLLRVINDDVIAPARGFDTHPHENMEIISIPLSGALRHKDSQGNEAVIQHGEVQIMSAGTGVTHSEFNDSNVDEVNLLQIWVMPKEIDISPRYDQQAFSEQNRQNKIQFIVSPIDSEQTGVKINQDAYFSLSNIDPEKTIQYARQFEKNGLYIFVINGSISINEQTIETRDAIALENVDSIDITAIENAQILIIDVPV